MCLYKIVNFKQFSDTKQREVSNMSLESLLVLLVPTKLIRTARMCTVWFSLS